MTEQAFAFGQFELFPERRLLTCSGRSLPLGSRAFDLLVALVKRAGQVVRKDELIAAAWPDTVVEDSSLRVHIAALRKALGEDHVVPKLITNVPGRGYCFVANLADQPTAPTAMPELPHPTAKRSLPPLADRVIGRSASVEAIAGDIERHRLVTITGSGGIGKTTVALQVAATVAQRFADHVVFIDLSAVNEDAMVASALAAALGYPVNPDEPVSKLASNLRDQHLLVVLDNCEHVIEGAAALAEALREAPCVHVLATSREILRATDEWVRRLPPLGLPSATGVSLTAADAMLFPAVELFVERAASRLGGYALTDDHAPVVAEICRKLDGIALAIELAAGRIDTMGLNELALSLDDCLGVLTQGRRTALPRHRTLRATFAWSYQLLPPTEQAVFRRLAVFNGPFTLDAARAVATGDDVSGATVNDCVRNLVTKSLVAADVQQASVRFRLLATSRAFAREQFIDTQEADRAARQHALYFQALFERAKAEWETRQTASWLHDYAGQMPNLRAALEWAFAPCGDKALGVALAVAAVPLWFETQQVDECLQWAERALAVVEADKSSYRRQTMHLHAALGFPIMRARFSVAKCLAAWGSTLAIAEELGDVDYQLRALWALWLARLNAAQPNAALEHADRFCSLEAETEPAQHRVGRRMRARALHLLGRQAQALTDVTAMLAGYVAPSLRSHVTRFHHDQRLCARVVQARIKWLQGHPDWALQDMEDAVAEAVSLRHTLTLIYVLAEGACPVALLAGNLAAAERFTSLFEDTIRAHALEAWRGYADCFRGELLVHGGEATAGVALLRRGVEALQQSGFILLRTGFLCALAQALAGLNRTDEGLAVVGDAMRQCERTNEAWCVPELRRLYGLLLLQQGDAIAAEASFRQSLREAQEQGAVSWARRTATDLDRLLRELGRGAPTAISVTPVHSRIAAKRAALDAETTPAPRAELPHR